jgi:dTDP-4-amino-4,6-dideoxygalactose transaminase
MIGVQPGDEIGCSSLTFAASAFPITYEKAIPAFIDSDAATWNMDPDLLAEWLEERGRAGRLPKAVVVVDLYGQCADYARILPICEKHGVVIIEDAAEALGATCNGRPAGSFGKTAIFSFNGNKILNTSGGGMLVSDDRAFIDKARFLATQARDPAPHYQHSEIGFNYRLSNVLAGIGRGQLRWLDERVAIKRHIFSRYETALGNLPGVAFMPEAAFGQSTRWLSCLAIDPATAPTDREKVRLALETVNIEARPVWKPLHLQPAFRDMGCTVVGGTVSERLFANGLCLPSGTAMSDAEQDRVIEVVQKAFTKP